MTRKFNEHVKWYLKHVVNRKRNPVKAATVSNWKYCAENWLNPILGEYPLSDINNRALKLLVEKLSKAGLSPQTIITYVGLVKLSLAAAVDENGEELYPRKWNNDFIDMPVIRKQHQPSFTPDTMSAIVEKASGQNKVLWAVLAATGLRVGEALGLEVKHVSDDARTLTVEQSCWGGEIQSPKTNNAYRKVDLCTDVAVMLGEFLEDRHEGLVFRSTCRSPLHQSNLLRRGLHPILESLGVEKCGFHAMRRFRTTHLRKQRAPEDLIRFWLGHAKASITDGYSKVAEDFVYRQAEAERVGAGFTI